MIYLDYAAHAPVDPVVLERFCDMERRFTANPNSVHAAGRAAREQMACAAEQIAPLENRRDRLLLNGSRLFIAGLRKRLEDILVQFQFFEFHKNISFPS